ncbi:MAG: hypothetical protein OEY14_08590 [Myxococcales bacterium]|nr:hypothetical protein [Myxococcales bacterium]
MRPDAKALSRAERELVAACIALLLPSEGPIEGIAHAPATLAAFEEFMRRTPGQTRAMLRLLLRFISLSPFLLGPRRRRFVSLGADEQRRLLEAMMRSRLYVFRTAFTGLRAGLTIALLGQMQVMQALEMAPDLDPFGLAEAGGEGAES